LRGQQTAPIHPTGGRRQRLMRNRLNLMPFWLVIFMAVIGAWFMLCFIVCGGVLLVAWVAREFRRGGHERRYYGHRRIGEA
jgi:uncharacterized membrane protein